MQNKFFGSFLSFLKTNGKDYLIDKQSKVIQADLLCLSQSQQEKILEQVGIPFKNFQLEGFKAKEFSDLWALELLIIENLKFSDLIARLWLLRQKFRLQVGEDLYKHYVSTLPNNWTDEKLKETLDQGFDYQEQSDNEQKKSTTTVCEKLEEAIRGDTINLTRQIQRLNYYKFLRLESIYKIKGRVLWISGIVLIAMSVVLFYLYRGQNCFGIQPQYFSLAILTIFFGMIGSCMSLLQRTEKATNAPTSFTDSVLDATDIDLSMSIKYICSLVLSGAIFSSILYLLAVSGFIDLGILFPKLMLWSNEPNIPSYCQQHNDISKLFGCIKSENKNALMLVWAFMAGFAERLVPDTLDSLMEKTSKPKT